MKVKALTSFAGVINMQRGETKDITDKNLLDDLLKCKYVEKVGKANEDKGDDE